MGRSSVWTVLVASSVALAASFAEPQGWEKARLAMTLQEFAEAYPQARPVGEEPADPAARIFLQRRELTGQKVGPLRNCRLEFHFTGEPAKLFRIEVRCAATAEEVASYLRTTYGEPTRVAGTTLIWTRKTAEVNFNPRGPVFSLNHIALSQTFVGHLLRAMSRPTPSVQK